MNDLWNKFESLYDQFGTINQINIANCITERASYSDHHDYRESDKSKGMITINKSATHILNVLYS